MCPAPGNYYKPFEFFGQPAKNCAQKDGYFYSGKLIGPIFRYDLIMKNTSLILTLLFSASSQAFILNDTYRSGAEVCRIHESQVSSEFSKLVSVPVDYDHPELGSTQLYAYTNIEFNKDLPSILFFAGGPGDSSRNNHFTLPHFNVIYFEQRGISCSRPQSRALYLDPKFYSSLNTARDAKIILDAFEVKKITAYGHSYGTVPATIFASLFPDRVRTLLLEGVIFHADQSLWISKQRDQKLQSIFDSFPLEIQNKIVELSSTEGVPPSWFSHIGNQILQINDGLKSYPYFLTENFANEFLDMKTFLPGFYTDPKRLDEEFFYGDVATGMIGCQELSMANPELSMNSIFSNRKLIKDSYNLERELNCRPLGLENNKNPPYLASLYPVSVPVTYLLGNDDPATPLDQGLSHYQKVAQGSKQVLIMEQGGHKPNLSLLQEKWNCQESNGGCDSIMQNLAQVKIFELIAGENFNDTKTLQNLIEDFNRAGLLKWRPPLINGKMPDSPTRGFYYIGL